MRRGVFIALVWFFAAHAQAQEQERKLLDRILKPDTTLQSAEQNKQFVVSGGEVMTKKASTRWFFFKKRSAEKEYAGVKNFQAKEYSTKTSRYANQQATTSTRHKLTKVDEPYRTTAYVTQAAHDSGKVAPTSDYSDARPFLAKGKSQKSLDAPQRPMTIDEVRELLNKNK